MVVVLVVVVKCTSLGLAGLSFVVLVFVEFSVMVLIDGVSFINGLNRF